LIYVFNIDEAKRHHIYSAEDTFTNYEFDDERVILLIFTWKPFGIHPLAIIVFNIF